MLFRSVRLQDVVGLIEVLVRGPIRPGPSDARVVDEHVEPSRIRPDSLPRGIDARLVGDVELKRPDRLGLGDLAGITRPGENEEAALLGELAGDLPPDPAIGAADQRDPAQILCLSRSFFPITIRWISEVPSPISRRGASR